jgi:AcrR family transcriptional regulator
VSEAALSTPVNETDSAKRQQILDGARRCFLAQGFDGSSMNDIVLAAGVSKGTVYAYFPSKEKRFSLEGK